MASDDDLTKQRADHEIAARLAADRVRLALAAEREKRGPAKSTVGGSLNPKDACGIAKAPVSTVSGPVLLEVGVAMLEGALKYGRHNYRTTGVRASVYYDATIRHLAAWWEGQDTDPDSGMSHITKAIAGLTVLRDSMIRGNWIDDRPPKVAEGWLDELNARAKELLAKYPDPKPAHVEVEV